MYKGAQREKILSTSVIRKSEQMKKDLPTLKWNSKSVGLAPNHRPKSRERPDPLPRLTLTYTHLTAVVLHIGKHSLAGRRAFGVLWSCNVCIDLYCPFLVMMASAYLPLRRGSLLWKNIPCLAKAQTRDKKKVCSIASTIMLPPLFSKLLPPHYSQDQNVAAIILKIVAAPLFSAPKCCHHYSQDQIVANIILRTKMLAQSFSGPNCEH